MRIRVALPALFFGLISCNNQGKEKAVIAKKVIDSTHEQPFFFPVTHYIKGQIFEIKNKGINPVRILRAGKEQDSTWIKVESLNDLLSDFLTPVIDSVNLVTFFTEKRFFDQTLDAITLTYDPLTMLPDSFSLKHWDVYIDPNSNSVKRIYMVKKTADKKTVQLTWQSNKWCKMVTIADDANGKSFIEKEVIIKWDF